MAWARTEILARRLAALKGILADAGKRGTLRMAADDDADAEDEPADPEKLRVLSAGAGVGRDSDNWTVLF